MYVFKFERAMSEQGWKVVGSHAASTSKVCMDARTVFASMPERPPAVLAVMNPGEGDQ